MPSSVHGNIGTNYGRNGWADKGQHAIDGLTFTTLFLAPAVCQHSIAKLTNAS